MALSGQNLVWLHGHSVSFENLLKKPELGCQNCRGLRLEISVLAATQRQSFSTVATDKTWLRSRAEIPSTEHPGRETSPSLHSANVPELSRTVASYRHLPKVQIFFCYFKKNEGPQHHNF